MIGLEDKMWNFEESLKFAKAKAKAISDEALRVGKYSRPVSIGYRRISHEWVIDGRSWERDVIVKGEEVEAVTCVGRRALKEIVV